MGGELGMCVGLYYLSNCLPCVFFVLFFFKIIFYCVFFPIMRRQAAYRMYTVREDQMKV